MADIWQHLPYVCLALYLIVHIKPSQQAKTDVLNGFLIPLKGGLLSQEMSVRFWQQQSITSWNTICVGLFFCRRSCVNWQRCNSGQRETREGQRVGRGEEAHHSKLPTVWKVTSFVLCQLCASLPLYSNSHQERGDQAGPSSPIPLHVTLWVVPTSAGLLPESCSWPHQTRCKKEIH